MKYSDPTLREEEFVNRRDEHQGGPSEKSDLTKPRQLHSSPDGLHRSDRAGPEESDHKTSRSKG